MTVLVDRMMLDDSALVLPRVTLPFSASIAHLNHRTQKNYYSGHFPILPRMVHNSYHSKYIEEISSLYTTKAARPSINEQKDRGWGPLCSQRNVREDASYRNIDILSVYNLTEKVLILHTQPIKEN